MRIDPFGSWVIVIAVGYVGYVLAQVALSVIESGMDTDQQEPAESVWMKEVEDGCIIAHGEMCEHGAAFPMMEWEEVDGEPIYSPWYSWKPTIEKGSR